MPRKNRSQRKQPLLWTGFTGLTAQAVDRMGEQIYRDMNNLEARLESIETSSPNYTLTFGNKEARSWATTVASGVQTLTIPGNPMPSINYNVTPYGVGSDGYILDIKIFRNTRAVNSFDVKCSGAGTANFFLVEE